MMALEISFKTVSRKFMDDDVLIENHWQTIVKEHSTSTRHYHNLVHLEHLLSELEVRKQNIRHWDSIVYGVAFHDIVYSVHRKDNEERSAEFATAALALLNVPQETIDHCAKIILATKSHVKDNDPDINYFIDADLSILGSSWERYFQYAQHVRREYRFYPDLIYKPGRRKVLQHFLGMDKIFKTKEFYDGYEISARSNLTQELRLLA